MKEKAKEKQQYTLATKPVLSVKQFLHIAQKTPKDHIYTRPAKGGGTWDFVTGVYVKKVLNYSFGWQWSFEVKDHGKQDDLVWVLGRLTIFPGTDKQIVKEQFGRADIKYKKGTKISLDYGNDLKSATTDALKKCASELGIASDVYGKNEFKDIRKSDFDDDDQLPEEYVNAINEINEIETLNTYCTDSQAKLAPKFHQELIVNYNRRKSEIESK